MMIVRKGNVLNFLSAYLISAFGYEFIFFVMTIYVYEVTRNAFDVGVFAALTFLPRLFAAFYGIIVDRCNRTKVFFWVSGITGLLVISLVLTSSLVWIYLVWSVISVFLTIIINVRTALMTDIMTQNNYLHGNSMVLMSLNLARVCAPLLAGVASNAFSIKSLIFLTGGMYFLVTLLCSRISIPDSPLGKSDQNVIADLKEGLTWMMVSVDLKFLISVSFLWRLFIGLQIPLFVVYVKDYLAGSDTDYGMYMTIIAIGSILGSLAGPWLVKQVQYSALIFWGMSIHYACFIILGLVDNFYLALIVVFLAYTVFYTTLVGIHSLRDKATRVDIRGRVYGSVTAILTPPAIFSMLTGGYLANAFGVEKVLTGAGVLALVSFYLLYLAKGVAMTKEVSG